MQTPRLAQALPRAATSACRPSALRATHQYKPALSSSQIRLPQRRCYSGPALGGVDNQDRPRGLRISHLFGALALMGMFVTTYGLLEWYFAFSTWPPEVRDDLKRAIKARNRGDIGGSEKLFQSAIDKARALPRAELGVDPLLKLTGLYITLAAMHESAGQPRKAFRTLQTGLGLIDETETDAISLSQKDRSRRVAIAQKMGSLALLASEPGQVTRQYTPGANRIGVDKEWEALAEKYLIRALEGMIQLGAPRVSESGSGNGVAATGGNSDGTKVVGRDFVFPDEQQGSTDEDKGDREISGESIAKVTRKSMGLTMESLADLYARQGKFERANPLYVQAVSTLLPPDTPEKKSAVSVADRCQAAMLINTLSSSLLNPPTTQNITASKAWSLRSLQLADRALEEDGAGASANSKSVCERARIVAEFNLGALLEASHPQSADVMTMEKDVPGAIKYVKQSQGHAKAVGFRQGVREAGDALDRLALKRVTKSENPHMPEMRDLIQLSRHDDHDNPFLQKQATPGPSRQRQYTQEPSKPMSRMMNQDDEDVSLPMPSPIPASKYAADRRQVESDLDRDLGGLTDDEFDSNHTFSRLGGFGKDTRSTIQSRSLLERQMGLVDTDSDDGMNISRGTESSFDAHARRSGLTWQPPTPFRGDHQQQHRHHQDHHVQGARDQLPSSSTESSSSVSTNSIELGRTAPAQQQHISFSRDQINLDDFERSLFVGGSPVSTLGHHASAVTFGAGIFANKGGYGHGHGLDDADEDGEYDPERGIEGLIAAAKIVQPSEREKNVFQHHENYQQVTSQRSIFGPNAGVIPNPSQRHLHRPVQPSPLRAQANSPLTSTAGSRSISQHETRKVSSGAISTEQNEVKKQHQGDRRASQGQGQARKVMGVIDGFDNARPSPPLSAQQAQQRRTSTGTKGSFDLVDSIISPKVRIVSASSTQLGHARPERSVSSGNKVNVGNGTGDLTGLTGMLATPAKGLLHRRVADDGERRQSGANIDGALREMESDMQAMRQETESSRSRIRELELELERARIAASKAQRDAEKYKGEKVELQVEVARLEDEKTALETLVEALKDDVFRLEANLDKEMGRVHMIQQEVQKRTPARPVRNKATEVQTVEMGDLLPLVNHLTRKVDGLEAEVARLKDVVEGAYERTVGEINLPLKNKQTSDQDAQRPPSRAHTEPGRKSQYADGVQTAAYYDVRSDSTDPPRTAPIRTEEGSKSRKTMMAGAAQDDGDSSPTPRSRVYGDSRSLSVQRNADDDGEGHRSGRRSVHHSRSNEPQEDPASSPFPAIRGDKLEREFFSPGPKMAKVQVKARQTKDLAARVEDADDVDEGYGGEEIVQVVPPVKTASSSYRPSKDTAKRVTQEIEHELDGGRVPPQTNVMKVLRELEDDYKHYLSIYTDLAEQYRRMSPLSTKRNVLAEHLKEVIDTMEQKANQVACLTEVLEVRDKPYMAPVIKAARASKARMSVPETVRAIRKDLGPGAVNTPQFKVTPRRRSGRHVAM